MTDETILIGDEQLPINFTKLSTEALSQGAICKMTDGMVATITTGDGDIIAGIVHTEVTAEEASPSVSIYRRGIFRGVAGVAGVTVGEAIQTDTATSSVNRLVNADVNSEQLIGIALETAVSGEEFLFELMPRGVNLA